MLSKTPWGAAQESTHYGRGIVFYSTASHGGFHVSPTLAAAMPVHLRHDDGWYEEDCDWCLVVLAFPDRFDAEMRAEAERTLRHWHPDAWEIHYQQRLEPGQSFVRDRQRFHEAHRHDYVTTAAVGDWHEGVPSGFVGVWAGDGAPATTTRSASSWRRRTTRRDTPSGSSSTRPAMRRGRPLREIPSPPVRSARREGEEP